jgi:TetR/AcrR family transcriptional repressor of nem operon
MPRSTAHKARTRARIIETAARAFRERGVEPVGIAEVMHEAGLTHGGFYAHFPSKEALVAEAAVLGMAESRQEFVSAAVEANTEAPVAEIIRRYVSRYHRDHPAEGCALPAMTSDVAREPDSVRHAFTTGLDEFIGLLTEYMPGATPEEQRDAALVLAAGMAGAVALSRAVDDSTLSDRLLLAARRFYTGALGGVSPRTNGDKDAPASS